MDALDATCGPMDGLRVVSVEQAVAAPFATRQMADLGAEVIKIERPDGGDFARRYDSAAGEISSYYFWLNRGKKSVVLDLKSDLGRSDLDALIGTADVFVHNLSPGAAERLGLTAAALTPRFPRLVVCQVRGYGSDGTNAARKAYDLLIQCETGLAVATGGTDHPIKVGISIADIAAGMYAFSGVLAALVDRAQGRQPRSVEISLFDSLAEWMSVPAYLTAGTGRETPMRGLAHPTIVPYGPQPVRDGMVVLAVQNEREWRRLCSHLLGSPELADDPRFSSNERRAAHRDELDALIAGATRQQTADELSSLLDRADIANARVRTVTEFLAHPELAARDRLVPVDVPGGTAMALRPPITMSGYTSPMGRVANTGQDTAAVLKNLATRRPPEGQP